MIENNQYAGALLRAVAFLVDAIIIVVINALITSAVIGILHVLFRGINGNSFEIISTVSAISAFLTFTLYFAFGESSNWQGTLGKKLARIKVLDQKGQKLTFPKALARSFAKFFSLLFFFVYLFIFLNRKRQALHDFY